MSLDAALHVASSGLDSINRRLALVSHNVANADTPGYTRKAVPREALSVGDQPMGLRTAEARRDVDAALANRLDASRAAAASACQAVQAAGQACFPVAP